MSKDFFKWFKLNIGSCLSWAITFAWLIFIYFKIHNGILPTNLNEFGDFIAGAFAPLAFFWLVRGFYQQGKGLEQNSKALRLQADELKKTTEALDLQVKEMRASVEQQSRLAEFYENELKQKQFAAKPFLNFKSENFLIEDRQREIRDANGEVIDVEMGCEASYDLIIENEGEVAKEISIIKVDSKRIICTRHEIQKKVKNEFLIYLSKNEINEVQKNKKLQQLFLIQYHDCYGLQYNEEIEINIYENDDPYINYYSVMINRYKKKGSC